MFTWEKTDRDEWTLYDGDTAIAEISRVRPDSWSTKFGRVSDPSKPWLWTVLLLDLTGINHKSVPVPQGSNLRDVKRQVETQVETQVRKGDS